MLAPTTWEDKAIAPQDKTKSNTTKNTQLKIHITQNEVNTKTLSPGSVVSTTSAWKWSGPILVEREGMEK